MSRQKFVVSRQNFKNLCHDIMFLCRDRVGNDGEILYWDRVWPRLRRFSVTTGLSVS